MDIGRDNYGSIREKLAGNTIGWRILYFPRLDSTMDIARQEAEQGAAEGTVIIAGEQTEGRGRIQRQWISPRGNIALSVILRPHLSCLPCLIMLASLAVVGSIEKVTGLSPQVKWPNDVLINGKKVCGILIENKLKGSRVVYAIIGMGINVEIIPSEYPVIRETATSLNGELGTKISPLEIVQELLIEMENLYQAMPETESIYRAWRDRLVTLNKPVSVASGTKTLTGTAESVDRDGSLVIRHDDGSRSRIVAGDVTLRHR